MMMMKKRLKTTFMDQAYGELKVAGQARVFILLMHNLTAKINIFIEKNIAGTPTWY